MIHPWAVIDPLFYQRERKQLGDSFVEDHNRRMAEDEERERRGAAAERERRAAEAEAFAVNSRGKGLIGACNNSWVMIMHNWYTPLTMYPHRLHNFSDGKKQNSGSGRSKRMLRSTGAKKRVRELPRNDANKQKCVM